MKLIFVFLFCLFFCFVLPNVENGFLTEQHDEYEIEIEVFDENDKLTKHEFSNQFDDAVKKRKATIKKLIELATEMDEIQKRRQWGNVASVSCSMIANVAILANKIPSYILSNSNIASELTQLIDQIGEHWYQGALENSFKELGYALQDDIDAYEKLESTFRNFDGKFTLRNDRTIFETFLPDQLHRLLPDLSKMKGSFLETMLPFVKEVNSEIDFTKLDFSMSMMAGKRFMDTKEIDELFKKAMTFTNYPLAAVSIVWDALDMYNIYNSPSPGKKFLDLAKELDWYLVLIKGAMNGNEITKKFQIKKNYTQNIKYKFDKPITGLIIEVRNGEKTALENIETREEERPRVFIDGGIGKEKVEFSITAMSIDIDVKIHIFR